MRIRGATGSLMGARVLALCVFVVAFGLYATTAGPSLEGYEPENAAVAEGLIRTGSFQVPTDSIFDTRPILENGKRVGRSGLPQELAESVFYAGGWALDRVVPNKSPHFWRSWAVLFYNPAVAALAASLFFLLILRLRRSLRAALAMTTLFTVASIMWPYSKIGMDTTLAAAMLLTFLSSLRTRDTDKGWPAWALVGFAAGMAIAIKPYAAPAAVATVVLLVPIRQASARRLVAFLTPLVAWAAAVFWFDWWRTGSIFMVPNSPYKATLAGPINLVGYLASPGKGLIFYSPLVLLGVAGLVAFWRAERRVAAALLATSLLFMLPVALTPYWTDETWGPRYIVPIAWLLLVPIPWWATTRHRRRALGAVAALAFAIQVAAVSIPTTQIVNTLPRLSGLQSATPTSAAHPPFLGNDAVRWIPQLSPVLIQSTFAASLLGQQFGAPPITYSYKPFRGVPHSLVLDATAATPIPVQHVYFWWAFESGGRRLLLIPLLGLGLAALLVLDRAARRGSISGSLSSNR